MTELIRTVGLHIVAVVSVDVVEFVRLSEISERTLRRSAVKLSV